MSGSFNRATALCMVLGATLLSACGKGEEVSQQMPAAKVSVAEVAEVSLNRVPHVVAAPRPARSGMRSLIHERPRSKASGPLRRLKPSGRGPRPNARPIAFAKRALVAAKPAVPWLLAGHAQEVGTTLSQVRAVLPADTLVIPGHDHPTNPQGLDFSINYLNTLRSEVSSAKSRGLTVDQTVAAVTMAPYQGYAIWDWVHKVVNVPATLASRTRLLGTGRTNKNDPNDALSLAAGYRDESGRTFYLMTIRDDRLGTSQRHTHGVARWPAGLARFTVDVLHKTGDGDSGHVDAWGATLGVDYLDWFVHVVRDPRQNFSDVNATRLTVGRRF